MADKCTKCDLPEDEHHDFVRVEIPAGCVCDPTEWSVDIVPPACAAFNRMLHEPDLCHVCEHVAACHVAPATPEASR